MTDLTVVIVSYNSRDYLGECLERVRAEGTRLSLRTVVVDNASTDGTVDLICPLYPEVQFLVNEKNLGFSTACNQGIRSHSSRFYLLLNPDCMVQPESLVRCVNFLESRPKTGIVGCRVENADGSLQLASRRSIPTPLSALSRLLGLSALFPRSRVFGRYNYGYLDERETHPVDSVSGSFLMFRQEILRDAGYLDERFFLYGEDLDFCFRTGKSGWEVMYFAGAAVTHLKRRSSRQNAAVANFHFYNAMKLFFLKHNGEMGPLKRGVVVGSIELLYRLSEIRRALSRSNAVGSGR